MRHFIFVALIVPVFSACNNAGSKDASGKSTRNAQSSAARGQLYLRTFYWAMTNTLDIDWIYLAGDGTIIRNPKHGTSPADIAAEKKDNTGNTGTYSVAGDRMKIKWDNGKTDDWEALKKDGAFSSLNGGVLSRPNPLPAGFLFALEYRAKTLVEGAPASSRIQFSNDGHVVFSGEPGNTGIPAGTGGSYEVNGNTLHLRFANGSVIKANICVLDESKSDSRELVINQTFEEI